MNNTYKVMYGYKNTVYIIKYQTLVIQFIMVQHVQNGFVTW